MKHHIFNFYTKKLSLRQFSKGQSFLLFFLLKAISSVLIQQKYFPILINKFSS